MITQLTRIQLLFSVVDILEQCKVPYCLVEGTLLGLMRENGFIQWDKDIDIGVRHEDLIPKMTELESLFRRNFSIDLLGFPYSYPREFHLHAQGYQIDIINYDLGVYKDAPVRFNVIHDQYASSYHAKDLFDEYKPFKFCGRTLYLPRDPERYLIETYGHEWRTPLKPGEYIAYPIIPGWFEKQKEKDMSCEAIEQWQTAYNNDGSKKCVS
jgi:phosphorylcholine metabolism protein LicD